MRRERYPARGSIEETDTERIFQRFDLQRDCWLGEQKMLGCFAKAQVLGNGAKHP